MKRYFDLRMLYDDAVFSILGKEMSFNKPDRFCLDDWGGPQDLYLENFEFSISQKGVKQGFLANNLGWIIIDMKRLRVESNISPSPWNEVRSWKLPISLTSLDQELSNYRIIGFKQTVECIDYLRSDLNWETKEDGSKYIASVQKLALRAEKIEKYNFFRSAECPVIPIISEQIYEQLIRSNLTGWGAVEIQLTE